MSPEAIKNRAHYRRENKKIPPPKQEGERKQEPTQCTGGSDRHLIPSGNEFSQATQGAGNPLEGRSGAWRLVSSSSRGFGLWPGGGISGIQDSMGTRQKWIHREFEGPPEADLSLGGTGLPP